jgi:hypothetical protein
LNVVNCFFGILYLKPHRQLHGACIVCS